MRLTAILLVLFACSVSARAAAPSDCWSLRKHGQTTEAHGCFEKHDPQRRRIRAC